MRLPQELVENIIDYFANDSQMLVTCSLVAKSWLIRSRYRIFNKVILNQEGAGKWCSAIRPGAGVSSSVRTLTLQQGPGRQWLEPKCLDAISDHISSFRHVENLTISWLDLCTFEPGSLVRHFTHFGSSLRSLRLSYLSAEFSTSISFLELFPKLEDLLIHAPDLSDDNPPLRISRSSPVFHGSLELLSFDPVSSPFISHLAGLDLQFSSISASHCEFSTGSPLASLLEASSPSLQRLELEYLTFSKSANVSLLRCENLKKVIVGAFEEGRPPLLLFSLLSTLSSFHLTHLIVDFVTVPSPQWSEWKAIDTHLQQMAERCGFLQGPTVVLRTRPGVSGDVVDERALLPKYGEVGPVELRLNSRHHRDDR